jgi:hypothetical protein
MDADNHQMLPGERHENDRLDSPDPGNGIVMPDIYADEPTVEVETLTLESEQVSISEESPGFNPYDTGILQK